jgi:para-nitrobenzyl esterase
MLGPRPPIDDGPGRRMRALWSGFARDGLDALGPTPLTIG